MGIHGIYKEIGPGRRVALSKYAVEHFQEHSRPLRLAIDISIWLFQIQSGKGGSNPALRTFYYRLLRLLSLDIHPLFVFDGPNKPLFKRNKRVGGPNVKVSSVPEFLAKQLLKQFGFPMHIAPGEAEAECALLQREGIVDAVLSEDVDTLMFGSGTTMRSWTPEMKSSKVPTHVNIYDAQVTKDGSGLDRQGMILIALMSGGDYIPEGIPGCGPKTACEAARAGFGAELCRLRKRDDAGFKEWRDRLRHELWTNESKLFKTKRRVDIPEDFPNREVLGYYMHPCISGPEKLASLRQTLRWDMPLDYPSLRSFTADAFDWVCISGAKKFVRNLAPAILTRSLRIRGQRGINESEDLEAQAAEEDRLVIAIHGRREHASTDNMSEIRISFLPMNIVNIDLSIEPPDEQASTQADDDSDSDMPVAVEAEGETEPPLSPRKRGPSKYNPEELEKIWIMDSVLRYGVPLKVQDWEASYRDPKQYLAAKRAAKEATKKKNVTGGMPRGALDPFTKVMKPGVSRPRNGKSKTPDLESVDLSGPPSSAPARVVPDEAVIPVNRGPVLRRPVMSEVNTTHTEHAVNRPKERPAAKRSSPDPLSPAPHHRSKSEAPRTTRTKQMTIIDLLSSSPASVRQHTPDDLPLVKQLDFTSARSPSPSQRSELVPLPDTVTKRRKKSPFKRYDTAPAIMSDDLPSPTLRDQYLGATLSDAPLDDLDLPLPSLTEPFPRGAVDLMCAAQTSPNSRQISSDDESGPRPVPISETVEALDLTSSAMDLLTTTASTKPTSTSIFAAFAKKMPAPVAQKARKKHYQLRESLEGAWKEVDVEVEIDLTSPSKDSGSLMKQFTHSHMAMIEARERRKKEETSKDRTRWRKSEVEVLDLTADD